MLEAFQGGDFTIDKWAGNDHHLHPTVTFDDVKDVEAVEPHEEIAAAKCEGSEQ